MSRQTLSLKFRVRYEGRAQTFDRRPTIGADLEKLPDPVWRTVGLVLRSKFRDSASSAALKKKFSIPGGKPPVTSATQNK